MIYISAEAGRGAAAAGNTQPADVLVTVTESPAGTPVSDLAQGSLTLARVPINCRFPLRAAPGSQATFSYK